MAQLKYQQVAAPDFRSGADILKTSQDQLQDAFGTASSTIDKYIAGRESKADGLLVQEIAKLKTEEDINAFLSSPEVQGKPLSKNMQEQILGLRNNLLGLQGQRAKIGGTEAGTELTKANTAGVLGRNEFIGLEGEKLAADIDNVKGRTALTGTQTEGNRIDLQTRGEKNQLGLNLLGEQVAGASLDNRRLEGQILDDGIKREFLPRQLEEDLLTSTSNRRNTDSRTTGQEITQRTQQELDEAKLGQIGAQTKGIDADTLLTGSKTTAQGIENRFLPEKLRLGNEGQAATNKQTTARTGQIEESTKSTQIDNRTLDQRNQADLAGKLASTENTKASTAGVQSETKRKDIFNQTAGQKYQADVARINEQNKTSQQGRQLASSGEKRTQTRFDNSLEDRETAIREAATAKERRTVRDTAVIKAFADPTNLSSRDVIVDLMDSGMAATDLVNAVNRTSELAGGGLGGILNPGESLSPVIQDSIQQFKFDKERGLEELVQTRIIRDAESLKGDTAGKLYEEFGIVKQAFNTKAESVNNLRTYINELSQITGTTPEMVGAALRDNFNSADPWLQPNNPSNVFDIPNAVDFIETYLSPDKIRNYNERKLNVRYENEIVDDRAKELRNVSSRIKKYGNDTVPNELLQRQRALTEELLLLQQ